MSGLTNGDQIGGAGRRIPQQARRQVADVVGDGAGVIGLRQRGCLWLGYC